MSLAKPSSFLIDRARDSSPRCSHEWREMQVSLFPGSPVKVERFSLLSPFLIGLGRSFFSPWQSKQLFQLPNRMKGSWLHGLLFYSCLQSISDNRKGSIQRAISWNGTRAWRAFLRGYGMKLLVQDPDLSFSIELPPLGVASSSWVRLLTRLPLWLPPDQKRDRPMA